MPHHLTLEVVDRDAVSEPAEGAAGSSRGAFLRNSAVLGGSVVAGGVLIGGLPKLVLGQASASQDVEILNFALTLEYLEAEFYTRAENRGALDGELARFAGVVGAHERAHVDFLLSALGDQAAEKPTFDFQGTLRDPQTFQQTAIVLEDTGVGAYNGAAPMLTKETLAAAATIVSVEARHAGWIRDIAGENPAPDAVDPLLSRRRVLNAVDETGFIQ